jgi:hypothetical protein
LDLDELQTNDLKSLADIKWWNLVNYLDENKQFDYEYWLRTLLKSLINNVLFKDEICIVSLPILDLNVI